MTATWVTGLPRTAVSVYMLRTTVVVLNVHFVSEAVLLRDSVSPGRPYCSVSARRRLPCSLSACFRGEVHGANQDPAESLLVS